MEEKRTQPAGPPMAAPTAQPAIFVAVPAIKARVYTFVPSLRSYNDTVPGSRIARLFVFSDSGFWTSRSVIGYGTGADSKGRDATFTNFATPVVIVMSLAVQILMLTVKIDHQKFFLLYSRMCMKTDR